MNIIVNRYNSEELIRVLNDIGQKASVYKRWQVSVQDSRGHFYDYYFAAKPTRKQIRKLRKENCVYHKAHCYECGKRIKLGDEFSFDDLNYAHWDCLK